MTYRAKKDGWLFALVIIIEVFLFGCAGAFLLGSIYWRQPLMLLPAAVDGAVGAMLVWSMVSTAYEITGESLLIRFGPLHWALPLETITEIHSTRRIVLEFGWGLAWSLDRVLVKCRDRMLLFGISPAAKEDFIAELVRTAPQVKVVER